MSLTPSLTETEIAGTETNSAPSPDTSPVLACQDLQVHLGGREVLSNINLHFNPGSITVVLGPNGAGKTTLVRSLLELIPRSAGKISHRGLLGYVPQRSDIEWDYPVTAKDVVLLGLIKEMSRWRGPQVKHYQRVAAALKRVQMLDLKDRPIGEMSGGQRQRIMIARALVREPSVLLLDEPFTGLDVPTQEMLSELFMQLAREGCAIVMSTHDLTHALHTADQVVLLNRTVRAHSTPAELSNMELWQKTFQVSNTSPLLHHVAALIETHAEGLNLGDIKC